ncbi:MAG: glycosyltransferase family 1 protein [Solirubrobacterales bacterium]|nr:glycosyltransferase family 1 protein [Solirubrobacterales bacterium]
MRAVVTGMIATFPIGGVAWDYGQYALALERLGFEVFYLEDAGWLMYDTHAREYVEYSAQAIAFLERTLRELSPSLADRWHLRTPGGRCLGLERDAIGELVADADLLLNVSGSCLLRDEYRACSRKVLIDTDPGLNHFVNYPRQDADPPLDGVASFRAHDHFFTYAERLGRHDCALPALGIDWLPTRPPVVLDRWQPEPPGTTWTTVMSWNNWKPFADVTMSYGSKEMEFPHVEGLPSRTDAPLEIAVGGSDAPRKRWTAAGWSVLDSHAISATADAYQSYVQRSRGELSVAKNSYVATRSGWFSCRSACYLAAGRPVVLQDTGFSEVMPTGEGLLAFSGADEAAAAIAAAEADYAHHARAARELARSELDSDLVVGSLLARVGL